MVQQGSLQGEASVRAPQVANYTKGEWKAHGEVIETEYAPNGAVIAVVNKATEKWEANAHLIVAAVNACIKLNPDNPMAVAESIGKLYEALKSILPYAEGNPVVYVGDILKAKQSLAGAEGK